VQGKHSIKFSGIQEEISVSMEFKDQVVYESYKNNSVHLDYVTQEWQKNVNQFLGMDFEDYS